MSWLDNLNPLKQLIGMVNDLGDMIARTVFWFDGRIEKDDAQFKALMDALGKSDAELEHACERLLGRSVTAAYIRDTMKNHPDKMERLRDFGRAKSYVHVARKRVHWKGMMRWTWVRSVHLAIPALVLIFSLVSILMGAAIDGVIPKSKSPLVTFGLFFTWTIMWFTIMLPMAYILRDLVIARRLVGTRIR